MPANETCQTTAIIACGALAREILALMNANGFDHVRLVCVPATLHNYPDRIPAAIQCKIEEVRNWADRIYVAMADCGTGGLLDNLLAKENVPRIGGDHCYAFYSGQKVFDALHNQEPGTFYLTDFLARQFETLIVQGLGLDRHPELRDIYFAHYKRLIYLAQTHDEKITELAKQAAEFLELDFERQFTGYGELGDFVYAAASGIVDGPAHDRLLAGHTGTNYCESGAEDGEATTQRAFRASHRSRRNARKAHRNRRLSRPMAQV